MNNFEEFLKDCLDRGATQVRLVPRSNDNGAVAFYAHPQGVSGDTFDGVAVEDTIVNMKQQAIAVKDLSDEELDNIASSEAGLDPTTPTEKMGE